MYTNTPKIAIRQQYKTQIKTGNSHFYQIAFD